MINKIKYGNEERADFYSHSNTCHDCGVAIGEYHQYGCDVEECPDCHLQKITCGCNGGKTIEDYMENK